MSSDYTKEVKTVYPVLVGTGCSPHSYTENNWLCAIRPFNSSCCFMTDQLHFSENTKKLMIAESVVFAV